MRTYLILKERAARWNADSEIQTLRQEIEADEPSLMPLLGVYSRDKAAALKARTFDRVALGERGMQYERLDQLTVEVLLGVRT
jgi:xylose isomerase